MISSHRQMSILFRDGELIELINGSFKEVDLILFKHNVYLKQLIGSNHCSVKWFATNEHQKVILFTQMKTSGNSL